MANTPKGIYFPEGDTPLDFVTIFKDIAESVDNTLGDFTYDSGWIDVFNEDMLNGWTRYNNSGFKVCYRRRGKLVYHAGLIRYGTEGTEMYYVPKGFRPSAGAEIFNCLTSRLVGNNSGYKGARINVNSLGLVHQSGSVNLGTGFISLNGIRYVTDEATV